MIRLAQIMHRFPGFSLGPIDLHLDAGEFFILLGPTGSGKTVILESIAGLRRPAAGKIFLNEQDVTKIPPEKRHVGIVYQDQSLFPHLNVQENIFFGLRYKRVKTHTANKALTAIIETLGLNAHLNKSIRDLSGGEKQRVALARALAIEPGVLLLDEPLSALDPSFRGEIQRLLKELHATIKTTCLMVTHDFNEAFYLADRVGVINKGILEQTGSVAEVFQRPANTRVGAFVGMKNILNATMHNAVVHLADIPLGKYAAFAGAKLGLRPEDIEVRRDNDFAPGHCVGKGRLTTVTQQGFGCEMAIDSAGETLLVHNEKRSLTDRGLVVGGEVFVGFHPDVLHLFPTEAQREIGYNTPRLKKPSICSAE